jgi:uncharacterized protein YdhG (YjbR/CyaY superfamily)
MPTPSFADQSPARRRVLHANWEILRDAIPTAAVGRKYDIDCLHVDGVVVAGLKGFAKHNSYFPFSGGVLQHVKGLPKGYSTTQGALRFPSDGILDVSLVKRLVRLRLAEMAKVKSGKRVVTFPDGSLKAVGAMRKGQLHGPWKWFRQDASLLRIGTFRDGVQSGTWVTYDRSGRVVTTKVVKRQASR